MLFNTESRRRRAYQRRKINASICGVSIRYVVDILVAVAASIVTAIGVGVGLGVSVAVVVAFSLC